MICSADVETDLARSPQNLCGLAGAAEPASAEPIFRAAAYLDAARLLAAADGVTLDALKRAALALKRGDEAEARRLLERPAR